jgi:hypothetical protein
MERFWHPDRTSVWDGCLNIYLFFQITRILFKLPCVFLKQTVTRSSAEKLNLGKHHTIAMGNTNTIFKKMKDSNSIIQITLLKTTIFLYFLYILVNSIGSSVGFFHDNSEFGFWAFISFLMISSIILFVDVVTILLISKSFKDKNKRVYILIFQMLICAIVYFGLNYMFRNAEKWNEEEINKNQTSQTDFSRTLERRRLVG